MQIPTPNFHSAAEGSAPGQGEGSNPRTPDHRLYSFYEPARSAGAVPSFEAGSGARSGDIDPCAIDIEDDRTDVVERCRNIAPVPTGSPSHRAFAGVFGSASAAEPNQEGRQDEHVATWVRLQSLLTDRASWWRVAQFGNASHVHLGGGTGSTEDVSTLAAKAVVAAFMLGPANEFTDKAAAGVRAAVLPEEAPPGPAPDGLLETRTAADAPSSAGEAGGPVPTAEDSQQQRCGVQSGGQGGAAVGQSGNSVASVWDAERDPMVPERDRSDVDARLVQWMERGLDLAASAPVHHYRRILAADVEETDGDDDDDVRMPAVFYSEEFGGVLNMPASWWMMFPAMRRRLKRKRPRYWEGPSL